MRKLTIIIAVIVSLTLAAPSFAQEEILHPGDRTHLANGWRHTVIQHDHVAAGARLT